jgi:hypothetical protein
MLLLKKGQNAHFVQHFISRTEAALKGVLDGKSSPPNFPRRGLALPTRKMKYVLH